MADETPTGKVLQFPGEEILQEARTEGPVMEIRTQPGTGIYDFMPDDSTFIFPPIESQLVASEPFYTPEPMFLEEDGRGWWERFWNLFR